MKNLRYSRYTLRRDTAPIMKVFVWTGFIYPVYMSIKEMAYLVGLFFTANQSFLYAF